MPHYKKNCDFKKNNNICPVTSNFSEKSKECLMSAELLSKNTYYNSSVNRSYYACIQFFFEIIFKRLNADRPTFDADARNNSTGTHGWAYKLVGNALILVDKKDYKWFQQKFPELKKLRETADYQEPSISKDAAFDAINVANSIITTTNKIKKQ